MHEPLATARRELAKHVAGTPLTEAEHAERRKAARARWAALGAAIAGTGAVGAAAGLGARHGERIGAAIASRRVASEVDRLTAERLAEGQLPRREAIIGQHWVDQRRDRIARALDQRKRDAVRFSRPVAKEPQNLKGATAKLERDRLLWRIKGSEILSEPPSAARSAALDQHLKSRPKPPRISGVARQVFHLNDEIGDLPQRLREIGARLKLDEFDDPTAPGGAERRNLVLAQTEFQSRLKRFATERARLLLAQPVGKVNRSSTTVTRRTERWDTSRKPKLTQEDHRHRAEASQTKKDYEAVRAKLRPLAEQQEALRSKLAAGEITQAKFDEGIRYVRSDPAWAVKKEIESRPSFFSAFRRKGAKTYGEVRAEVGKTWKRRGGVARASHRDLTPEDLKEIGREVRDRASRVAARANAHAERLGAARLGSGAALLARYRASIRPVIEQAARLRGGRIGRNVGAIAGAVGTALALRGVTALLDHYHVFDRGSSKLGKAFDGARHPRDPRGRFAQKSGAPVESTHKPRVTLLIGQPGSGKSTWRAMHMAQGTTRPTVVISTDDTVQSIADQHGLSYKDAYRRLDVDQLERGQRRVMRDAIAAGHDVIVDRTNLTAKSRARTMRHVPGHYERHAIVFDVPEPELRRRRRLRAGKEIPRRTLADMRAMYQPPQTGEFDGVSKVQVGSEPLAKAAKPRKPRQPKSRAAVVDGAEAEVAQRLATAFGDLKDSAEAKMLKPDGTSLHATMLDTFDHALEPLQAAAHAGASDPIPVEAGPREPVTIAFSMLARSPYVQDYIDQYRQSRVVELADEQRDAIKTQLVEAAMAGASPQQMARRIKETIGLTSTQMQHVNNYRAELEQLDPNALNRALRDRRFDAPIARSLKSGEVLSPDKIDQYVDAYHRRYLAFRATTIARTEGVGAANNGQMAAARGYLAQHPDYRIIKTWIATADDRTRHDHRELNGQEVEGFDTPFVCSDGADIRWPHDAAAPANQVIGCRCTLGLRIVPGTSEEPPLPGDTR